MNTKELKQAVTRLSKTVPRRAVQPILGCMRMQSKQIDDIDHLTLSATNLDTWVTLTLTSPGRGVIKESFDVCVDVRQFRDALSAITAERVGLAFEDNKLKLAGVAAIAPPVEFATFDSGDYLQFPGEDMLMDNYIKLSAGQMEQIKIRCLPMAGGYGNNSILAGVNFSMSDKNDKLDICSTDGSRLSHIKIDNGVIDLARMLGNGLAKPAIVPAASLEKIFPFIKGHDVAMHSFKGNNMVGIVSNRGNFTAYLRLTAGDYPNYQQLFPIDHKFRCEFMADDLVKALKQVEPAADCKTYLVHIAFDDIKETMILTCETLGAKVEDLVRKTATVNLLTERPAKDRNLPTDEMAVNIRYLLDAAESMGAAKEKPVMRLEGQGLLKPLIFTCRGDDTYRHLLMPVQNKRKAGALAK